MCIDGIFAGTKQFNFSVENQTATFFKNCVENFAHSCGTNGRFVSVCELDSIVKYTRPGESLPRNAALMLILTNTKNIVRSQIYYIIMNSTNTAIAWIGSLPISTEESVVLTPPATTLFYAIESLRLWGAPQQLGMTPLDSF